MKKNKLNLDSFKVQSFVTSLSELSSQTAKGGGQTGANTMDQCSQGPTLCEYDTSPCICDNTENVNQGCTFTPGLCE